MRRQTTFLLLPLLVLAAACSKSNYALVEPDDLYFTKKDRKEAMQGQNASEAIMATSGTEVATSANDGYDYASQHAPVLTTTSASIPSSTTPSSGTINSTTLGSPTIQQYAQQPYYDSSVNPDYITGQAYDAPDESYAEYYIPDYQYTEPQTEQAPQITNNYYGVNPYSYNAGFYDPFYNPFYGPAFGMSMYNAAFGNPWAFTIGYSIWSAPFYGSYFYDYPGYYNSYYSNCYYSPYTAAYLGYPSYYNNVGNINYYTGGGSTNYDNNISYANGQHLVYGPRKSMNNVSYYVEKQNTTIKRRRDDYLPQATEESGRIANSSGRTDATPTPARVEYIRRGSSTTYTVAGSQNSRTQPSSATVQQYGNRTENNRTQVVPTQTRRTNSYGTTPTVLPRANRSNNQQGTYRNTESPSRYVTPTRSNSGSFFGTPSRSSSGSGYSPSRSSTSRPAYTPTRSSGSTGPSYTPSRSTGGSRSSGSGSSGGGSRGSSGSSSSGGTRRN